MSFKKSIIYLFIIFTALMMGCDQNVLLDEQSSKLLNYNFKISNLTNIDKSLTKQRYSYSTDISKKYIAVIIYKSKDASMKQYIVSKDETINLTVPEDSNFIISLPANRTISYTWNMEDTLNNGEIQLENRSWINIPIPKSEKNISGTNYDRQNFYLKPIKSGNGKITMIYKPNEKLDSNSFRFTFTINIK